MLKATNIAVIGLTLTLALAAGCLVSGSSHTTYSGTNVAPGTFDQIKAGSTTIGWVHATLGEPTTKTQDGDDEVWKYTYTEHTDSSGAVFLIFGGSSSTETVKTVFIEFKDGVVINKWQG
ncbi:MAG TPA: hypothetical protein VL992_12000 [Tepidisphaeraceae bacterium]|nr:hypothetical protein [Tepidisphaeraceae bacterium]